MCFARKVCGLVRSTRGTSQGEGKLGARDKILNTKVARRACAGQTFPRILENSIKRAHLDADDHARADTGGGVLVYIS